MKQKTGSWKPRMPSVLERGDEVRTFVLKGDKSAKYIPEEAEIAYGDIT